MEEKVVMFTTIALAINAYRSRYTDKQPKRTSLLSGNQYTNEILNSQNFERTNRILRMSLDTFKNLVKYLKEKELILDF